MTITFVAEHDPKAREHRFVITIPEVDYGKVRYSAFDMALLRDCQSDDATIADKVLALEMVCRRIQEAINPPTGCIPG